MFASQHAHYYFACKLGLNSQSSLGPPGAPLGRRVLLAGRIKRQGWPEPPAGSPWARRPELRSRRSQPPTAHAQSGLADPIGAGRNLLPSDWWRPALTVQSSQKLAHYENGHSNLAAQSAR